MLHYSLEATENLMTKGLLGGKGVLEVERSLLGPSC